MVSFGDSDEDDYQDAAQDTCTSTAASFGSRGAPDPIEVRMRSGRALYEAKDFKAAEVSFLDAFRFAEQTQIKPSVVQAANNVAACSLRRGAYNEVRLWTDHVLKVDPDNLKALYRRWLAFTKLGKSSEAAETLSALDELSLRVTLQSKTDGEKHAIVVDVAKKEKGDQLRKEGNELMSNGKTELAIKAYTAALQEQPFDSAAFSNRAKAYLNLEKYEDAEKDATKALLVDPGYTRAMYRRGLARLGRSHSDKEGACADLARVVSKCSSTPERNEATALLLRAVGGIGLDGDTITQKAENEESTSPNAGKICLADTKKRPGSLMIVEKGDDGEGCSWCPVVPEKREQDGQASHEFWQKGEHFRKNKNWASAGDLFARGVVADPSNSACWIGLSRVHREQGKFTAGAEAASRALKAAPASRCALLCLAAMRMSACSDLAGDERQKLAECLSAELERTDNATMVDETPMSDDVSEEYIYCSALLQNREDG